MKFRNLRIAWTIFWSIACVLLIALWMRSYWCCYTVIVPLSSNHGVVAQQSHVGILFLRCVTDPGQAWSIVTSDYAELEAYIPSATILGFCLYGDRGIKLPFWFLISICASISALFFFKRQWRFTLRTLLIATTLVAMVLGLMVAVL
jgi:hypothetical protein